jgi:hypothetical protein
VLTVHVPEEPLFRDGKSGEPRRVFSGEAELVSHRLKTPPDQIRAGGKLIPFNFPDHLE